ncbi:myophilin-like [Clavelina lepadiformis]|uniref:myophilin-like n=1 Tax=Clavelina lepadiformis TaxID=159417 RepID=UPI0040418AD2
MASRPTGYGMTAELAEKKASKYDPNLDNEIRDWISRCTGIDVKNSDLSSVGFQETFKDGTILCTLINVINPGSVRKINESKMAFKQMENIDNFLDACERYGVLKKDLFQTVDLFEAQNIPQVINGLQALATKYQRNGGIAFGPKESTQDSREFTEEQLQAGSGAIGMQMGSNRGTDLGGDDFGKERIIKKQGR